VTPNLAPGAGASSLGLYRTTCIRPSRGLTALVRSHSCNSSTGSLNLTASALVSFTPRLVASTTTLRNWVAHVAHGTSESPNSTMTTARSMGVTRAVPAAGLGRAGPSPPPRSPPPPPLSCATIASGVDIAAATRTATTTTTILVIPSPLTAPCASFRLLFPPARPRPPPLRKGHLSRLAVSPVGIFHIFPRRTRGVKPVFRLPGSPQGWTAPRRCACRAPAAWRTQGTHTPAGQYEPCTSGLPCWTALDTPRSRPA
jgi:hypothetical protein